MSEDYDIKVQIKEDLKRGLIFGLRARPSIGIVLGFAGYENQVTHLMKTLSHQTRAYIVNADGLPGFLQELNIAQILSNADKNGLLEEAKKW